MIIDVAGPGTTTASAVDAVRPRGRVVQIGTAREEATISTQRPILEELTVVVASDGEESECAAVPDLTSSGGLVSRTVPITFAQIPEHLGLLAPGQVAGRAVALL